MHSLVPSRVNVERVFVPEFACPGDDVVEAVRRHRQKSGTGQEKKTIPAPPRHPCMERSGSCACHFSVDHVFRPRPKSGFATGKLRPNRNLALQRFIRNGITFGPSMAISQNPTRFKGQSPWCNSLDFRLAPRITPADGRYSAASIPATASPNAATQRSSTTREKRLRGTETCREAMARPSASRMALATAWPAEVNSPLLTA